VDWKWLYVIAGSLCTLLIIMAYKVDYPEFKASDVNAKKGSHFVSSLNLLKKPYSMGFSIGAFLYVAAESAIYVWMPSYLVCDASSLEDTFACYASNGQQMLAMCAVAVFFSLRAAGRFVGIWMMQRFNWALVLMLFSGAILVFCWRAIRRKRNRSLLISFNGHFYVCYLFYL
jgi:FHS family L-fucose permease-like MFS transporter